MSQGGQGLQDTPALLALLTNAGVPFVVIGGVAAIAHGASTFTRDLDVGAEAARSARRARPGPQAAAVRT